jgi:predicted RNase H-like HicB family nuclease
MPSISLSAVLNPEESGGYVALCPELDIASQGESIEQAMHNLKEAVEGFFVASPACRKSGGNRNTAVAFSCLKADPEPAGNGIGIVW